MGILCTHIFVDCPTTVIPTDPGTCNASLVFQLPSATDNCGIANLVAKGGVANGTVLGVGSYVVVFEATDYSDNSASCNMTFVIQVRQRHLLCMS
jgi:hypothetical protein